MRLLTFGETPLRFSPAGHERLATARRARIHADGTESNAAAAAAALDADTTWVSRLPDAPPGRRVVSELRSHGVETQVAWADPADCRQGVRFDETSAPPRVGVTHHDRGGTAVANTRPADLPMESAQSVDAVFTSTGTLALSETVAETGEALLRAARNNEAVTATDLDHQPGLTSPEAVATAAESVLDHVDVLVARRDCVERVLDRSGQPRELALRLAADHDCELVAIARSDRHAVVLHDSPGTNVVHERRVTGTETVDPAGGHGAFVGAFLERYVSGADAAEALSHAVAAGALTRTLPGPFLSAGPAELRRVIDDRVEAAG
ncbi:MAG: PfkB family carbohydrate kinase [Salinirussus sp.]